MIKPTKTKSGFTLVELSVSALIIAMIALVLIMVFRSNINAWKWGQKHMEFNQQIQLIMKQVFTDLKRINPVVLEDADGDIWFQGEKIGDMFPNLITLVNTDNDALNGGEELNFFHAGLKSEGRKETIHYFLDGSKLVREITDYDGNKKQKYLAEKASELKFNLNPDDIREIVVKVDIQDPKNPKMIEKLNFAVRLDTDLVCVKMVDK